MAFGEIEDGIMGASYAPLAIVSIAAAVLVFAWRLLRAQVDPLEPPPLKPRIPILGHLLGMIRYHTVYFEKLQ